MNLSKLQMTLACTTVFLCGSLTSRCGFAQLQLKPTDEEYATYMQDAENNAARLRGKMKPYEQLAASGTSAQLLEMLNTQLDPSLQVMWREVPGVATSAINAFQKGWIQGYAQSFLADSAAYIKHEDLFVAYEGRRLVFRRLLEVDPASAFSWVERIRDAKEPTLLNVIMCGELLAYKSSNQARTKQQPWTSFLNASNPALVAAAFHMAQDESVEEQSLESAITNAFTSEWLSLHDIGLEASTRLPATRKREVLSAYLTQRQPSGKNGEKLQQKARTLIAEPSAGE